MNRIFLPKNNLIEQKPLIGEYHKKISVVLRSRPQEKFIAICGDGFEYEIEINSITHNKTKFHIINKKYVNNETSIKISIYMGILKNKGIEEIIPSLVYLGASEIIPIYSQRTQSKKEKISPKKIERIEKIIQRATILSKRTQLLKYSHPLTFENAINKTKENNTSILFWEEAPKKPLKKFFKEHPIKKSIGIFIGPEGGFTPNEAKLAQEKNIPILSIGKRILDAKTAPITALSAILYEIENI